MAKSNQNKINFSLTLENIGKHKPLVFSDDVNSLKIALYAMNGSGKTFISRAFRLAEMQNYSEEDRYENINKINKLISFGQEEANITLNIKSNSFEDELDIELIKDCGIKFNKKSNYYFHVFNSDYVRENIEIKKYELSENVNGYILGKDKIELSNEYDNKLKLENKKEELRQQIEYVLDEGLKDLLSKFKISPLLTEYKNITFDTIISDKEQENDSDLDFSYLLNEYTNIANKLGDYQDIESIDYTSIDNISFIDEIQKKLKEKYSKSNFAEDFVIKISNKREFIELGLINMEQNAIHCPFCKQKLNDNAKKLIYDYNKFLDAKETEILNFLIDYKEQLNKYKDKIVEYKNKFDDIHKKYDNLKLYFSQKPLKDFISLDEKYIVDVLEHIDEILKEIDKKKLDISREINVEECVCKFKDTIKKIIDICKRNTRLISQINKLKREPRGYIKYLRKSACEAKLIDIKKQLKSNIGEYNNIYMKLQSIQKKYKKKKIK
nr:AAA family ATPase [Campylobacter lari]MCR2070420.1 AAA family ATPase [Campylobacter lari subsp. concheus]